MTESKRILVEGITGIKERSKTFALAGSIQNYRRIQKKKGRLLSFHQAAEEWRRDIYLPVISSLKHDTIISFAIGRSVQEYLFTALYAVEDNAFRFEAALVRKAVLDKAHGLRAAISRLIA